MSDLGGIRDRLTLIVAGGYFDDCRYVYDANDNLIYMGFNLVHKTATSEADWYIWKYTYDASDNLTRKEGPLEGSWDNRASLAWA
jgi:YD repeat-containing protein